MKALDNRHMALAPWADEEDVEEDVKKRSVTPDAMGAKTLCIPFEQVVIMCWEMWAFNLLQPPTTPT